MQTFKLKSHIDDDGHLRLDVPTDLPGGDVNLVVTIEPASAFSARAPRYDFSDLTGALRWTGDAVKEQQKLRDEWR